MSCHSSYTYNPRIPAHNLKRILTGLKTDKTHKNSSFTIIGYNIAIQITKDGYVRPSLGEDPYNPAINIKVYKRAQKIVAIEKDGQFNFEIIAPPPYKSKMNATWYDADEDKFKWEYKY
jgi:hypothetical protein